MRALRSLPVLFALVLGVAVVCLVATPPALAWFPPPPPPPDPLPDPDPEPPPPPPHHTPEPSSLILLSLGAGALGLRAWRKKNAPAD